MDEYFPRSWDPRGVEKIRIWDCGMRNEGRESRVESQRETGDALYLEGVFELLSSDDRSLFVNIRRRGGTATLATPKTSEKVGIATKCSTPSANIYAYFMLNAPLWFRLGTIRSD